MFLKNKHESLKLCMYLKYKNPHSKIKNICKKLQNQTIKTKKKKPNNHNSHIEKRQDEVIEEVASQALLRGGGALLIIFVLRMSLEVRKIRKFRGLIFFAL